jgi:Ca-activated chloride channel homolog
MLSFGSTAALLRSAAIAGLATLATTLSAHAVGNGPVKLEAELGSSAVTLGKGKKIYLRINLEGLAAAKEGARTPVNVGLVIDRSGSMEDENKIGRAREAAIMALGRLGREDVASVTAFNHDVDVLLPASKVVDHGEINRSIDRLVADGNTALYAGTDQGIREVEKFLAKGQVNRVILISDGLANVGPSEPREVAELGRRAASKGITITTIGLGLGYNEDLMSKLAYASDGNHAFVERADELVKIFNKEFGDVLSVVAQDIIIEIRVRPGFKPLRMLGREAEISGETVRTKLAQIYGNQQKYAVLELEVADGVTLGERDVAEVAVSYAGMGAAKVETVNATARVRVTDKIDDERASLNGRVMGDITTQLANEVHEEATRLRDEGKIAEAKKVLGSYASALTEQAASGIAAAAPIAKQFSEDSAKMESDGEWNKTRKAMRAFQYKNKVQQSY